MAAERGTIRLSSIGEGKTSATVAIPAAATAPARGRSGSKKANASATIRKVIVPSTDFSNSEWFPHFRPMSAAVASARERMSIAKIATGLSKIRTVRNPAIKTVVAPVIVCSSDSRTTALKIT